MSPNGSSSLISVLLVLGGAVFGVLGAVHAIYTFLDLRDPRRLVPVDPLVAQAMANTPLRSSRGATDMWRAWIGFNFSHSLGVLLVGALAMWAGSGAKIVPISVITPTLTLIGCVYLVLCLLYWFRTPALGVALGTGCFAAAWILSLR